MLSNGQIQDNQLYFGLFWLFMIGCLYMVMDNHFENHETKHQTDKK